MADQRDQDTNKAPALESDPIFQQLRKVYDDVASEPLPDRFLELLAKLDEAERKR